MKHGDEEASAELYAHNHARERTPSTGKHV